jgi:hypothetical protein
MSIIKILNKLNNAISKKYPNIKRLSATNYQHIDTELEERENNYIKLFSENQENHYTVSLHLEKSHTEAFYLSIKNKSTFEMAFKYLIAELDELKESLQNYIKSKKKLPEDFQRSITHLIKYLEMFQTRLGSGTKINDSNFNSSRDYREAAREKLTELFRSSFMSKCMQVIADGCRVESKKHYYLDIVKIFNAFLMKQGIYSKLFQINDEIDYRLFIPESKATTNISELNGRIADIYMLPYFFNDPNYNGHALISEGTCVAYSTQ